MSKSLQDQLLGAGLVDAKKAKQIGKENRKAKNQRRRNKETQTASQQAAQQSLREKQIRDRELNLARQAEADHKALTAQIIQLVNHYKLNRSKGDVHYNFKDGKHIKKIWVTQAQVEEISRGRLCIVLAGEQFELVPKPIAEKIQERDPAAVLVSNKKTGEASAQEQDADAAYYAQFEIPDDLVW